MRNRFFSVIWGIGLAIVFTPDQRLSLVAQAQVIPDNSTLTEIGGCGSNCLIHGGIARGSSLFHSFQEFNVNTGQTVRFNNDPSIRSIFTRVTGDNLSTIDGLLGVNGIADLFLLNPNGIVFGRNARLDIAGSFVATTADRFTFLNGNEFSAVNPQAPPLLNINVPPGLQYGTNPGAIAQNAHLSVGENLTLAAATIDVRGSITTGGDLNIQALDTLNWQDSSTQPTIAIAGEDMILTGDRAVTINALNHPSSYLRASGDLTVRSSNPVESSAIWQAGGSIQVDQSAARLATLISPFGSVLQAGESVSLRGFTGGSLQIDAGDRVTVTNGITITGPFQSRQQPDETTASAFPPIRIATPRPTLDIQVNAIVDRENTSANILDGVQFPLATIRVGGTIRNNGGNVNLRTAHNAPFIGSRGSIQVENIATRTTQPIQDGGDIRIESQGGIRARNLNASATTSELISGSGIGNGGSIRLEVGRNGIRVGQLNTSAAYSDRSQISIESFTREAIASSTPDSSMENPAFLGTGNGGSISLRAASGRIYTGSISSGASIAFNQPNALLNRAIFEVGNGGGVTVQAANGAIRTGRIRTASSLDLINFNSQINRSMLSSSNGGTVILWSRFGDIQTGTLFTEASTSIFQGDTSQSALTDSTISAGNGGSIRLEALNGRVNTSLISSSALATVTNLQSQSAQIRSGRGGTVDILAGRGVDGSQSTQRFSPSFVISSSSGADLTTGSGSDVLLQSGASGAIHIEAGRGDIRIQQLDATSQARPFSIVADVSVDNGNGFRITRSFSWLQGESALRTGNSGDIRVQARRGSIYVGEVLAASRTVFTEFEAFPLNIGRSGDSGNVTLQAAQNIRTGAINTTSQSASGSIRVVAGGDVTFGNFSLSPFGDRSQQSPVVITSDVFSADQGGSIQISANRLIVSNGTQISASTYGPGTGGDIVLNADKIVITGTSSLIPGSDEVLVRDGLALLRGGAIGIRNDSRNQFIPVEDSQVGGITRRSPELGNVSVGQLFLLPPDFDSFPSGVFTQTSRNSTGNAGSIRIQARELNVSNGGAIAATTFGSGNGGDIHIQAHQSQIGRGSGASILTGSALRPSGQSGDIFISGDLLVLDEANILTETANQRGGDISIILNDALFMRGNSRISTTAGTSQAGGDGGNITIEAEFVGATGNENDIVANAFSGRGGNITIAAENIFGIEEGTAIPGNGTNDIDASSELSDSGTVLITTPNASEAVERLVELPDQPVDTVQQVATTCPTSGDIAGELGEFIITGRGGIPANPADIMGRQVLASRLASVTEDQPSIVLPIQGSSALSRLYSTPSSHLQSFESVSITEAQGWVRNSDGLITLVATPDTIHPTSLPVAACADTANSHSSS